MNDIRNDLKKLNYSRTKINTALKKYGKENKNVNNILFEHIYCIEYYINNWFLNRNIFNW